ncbi:hypothetical protein CLAFUW4_06621 [Fulvia fulva]|uniref:Xylanolytic transcriptional activator regulatory domain-containing protein n=1 Tax=Passalora fulva TaxID=5499 RepID=A0A9Q8PAC5_PASFU|nr:uncharacterized protein CLAFUR5_06766 [Fulvia fulva]KAK4621450.1 hypothetical protein CLAFUR4_06629 [Fulvia fulva]KAK4622399.1 hypothetical protein CLAFUR0_06623 [Fulvia fulva]UJO18828.1 hypothetical protein CLAFUR5_06766 [Fulvia fulva]WPV16734.1 hypothetical protein CLAFUW4_06621 [Fulvia fulva]WPV31151.1 hypothetical protein CLAFUW7_06620 [Fulvia fulva]
MSISQSPLTSSHGIVEDSTGSRQSPSTWPPAEEQAADGQVMYPFRNFWSPDGNIGEVLFALPTRERADALISSFFEHIDPLYPIISENMFRNRFEEFWALPANERSNFNTTWVALQFIVFASGHLYLHDPTAADFTSISETYLSCCYRALVLGSFLSEWSLGTIQVLILICNYFVTNNRTADCWTFSGILQKVAYGLELHLPPAAYTSISEKHLRCALWQAFMFQDVSLSYFLELVPASCHHTIDVSQLQVGEDGDNNLDSRLREMLSSERGDIDIAFIGSKTDIAYQRAIWKFSKFMQKNICLPSALGKPIAKDIAHKAGLISDLQRIYDNIDPPFNNPDLPRQHGRVWRQMIMIASNYNFALSMLYLAHNPAAEVNPDWRGALRSSNKVMSAFFSLVNHDRQYLTLWTPIHTRAYAQTLMICKALSTAKEQTDGNEDPWLQLAVGHYERYVDLLTHAHGSWAFELKKREYLNVLAGYRDLLSPAA